MSAVHEVSERPHFDGGVALTRAVVEIIVRQIDRTGGEAIDARHALPQVQTLRQETHRIRVHAERIEEAQLDGNFNVTEPLMRDSPERRSEQTQRRIRHDTLNAIGCDHGRCTRRAECGRGDRCHTVLRVLSAEGGDTIADGGIRRAASDRHER